MMALTLVPTPFTILPNTLSSETPVQLDVAEPSCTSMTTTSAPAARSAAAPVFTSSTTEVTLMSAMPDGETRDGRSSVTAPTKPTLTPPTDLIQVAPSDTPGEAATSGSA